MVASEQPDLQAILSAFDHLSRESVLVASHYEVACSISLSDGLMRASAKVRARATRDHVTAASIMLVQSFTIEEISIEGKACSYTRRDNLLRLELPMSLTEGQWTELYFEYGGSVPPGSLRSSPDGNCVELQMQSGWLPLPHPPLTEWYTFRLECELPVGVRAIASGEEIDIRVHNGLVSYLWEAPRPTPDLVVIVGRYEHAVRKEAGVTLEALVLPSAPYRPESVIGTVSELLTLYQDQFGPYPFDRLKVACPPGSLSGNYAIPGLVIAGQMQKDPAEDIRGFSILAHELSHTWWGFQVRNDARTDLWLMESLAGYSTLLAIRERYGQNGLIKHFREWMKPRLRQVEESGVPLAKCTWATPNSDQLREDKGAAVLLMLQRKIGKQCFEEMLREFASRYAGKQVTTSDFVALTVSKSGRDLENFFARYLYGTEAVGPQLENLLRL